MISLYTVYIKSSHYIAITVMIDLDLGKIVVYIVISILLISNYLGNYIILPS